MMIVLTDVNIVSRTKSERYLITVVYWHNEQTKCIKYVEFNHSLCINEIPFLCCGYVACLEI